MSDDSDSPGETRADRRVQDALDELHHRRAEFRRARQLQQVSQGVHLRFQQAVLDALDELRPYREEVEEEWEEATPFDGGLDVLPGLVEQTRTTTDVVVQNGVPQRETTTEPYRVPERALLAISHDVDDIAAELGFGAEVDASETRTDIDEELIEEVEQWRARTLE